MLRHNTSLRYLLLNVYCLGGIALAQAISPIATHFSVAWSVVCCSGVVEGENGVPPNNNNTNNTKLGVIKCGFCGQNALKYVCGRGTIFHPAGKAL